MTVTILPATLVDVAELGGARSRFEWQILRDMIEDGRAQAAWLDGRPIALAGLYAIKADAAEAWFCVTPAAAPHMRAIVRAMRLTIRASPYREIVAHVGTPAGRRIARACGLSQFSETSIGEVWQWMRSPEEASERLNEPSRSS